MARIKAPVTAKLNMLAIAFDQAAMAITRQQPCESSGSEHFNSASVDSPAAVNLSDLVNSFLERDYTYNDGKFRRDFDDENGDDVDSLDAVAYGESKSELEKLLKGDGDDDDEEEREMIRGETDRALQADGGIDEGFKRRLLSRLRDSGFDAGLCKSRWEKNGRRLGGRYEYIDVKVKVGGGVKRYVVEVNLGAEFEVARPTAEHAAMLSSIPEVYVGKAEEMRRIVKLMCGVVRQSMKAAEMQVPPWRRSAYMEAKWFGPYKRTVNGAPSKAEPMSVPGKREVGFGAGLPAIRGVGAVAGVRLSGGMGINKVSRLTTALEA